MERHTFRNILWMGGGAALGQLLSVLFTPVLTRLYDPSVYGAWALWISIGLLFGTLSTFRYELAIVLAKDARETNGLTLLSIALTFVTTALLLIVGKTDVSSLESLLGLALEHRAIAWAPALVCCVGLLQSLQGWIARKGLFKALALSNMSLAIASLLSQTYFGIVAPEHGLITGTLIGYISAIALSVIVVVFQGRTNWFMSIRELWGYAKKYQTYPFHVTPYSIVGVLRERLVFFLLSRWVGTAWVGRYAFSQRLVNLPNNLVSSTIRPVLFQQASVNGIESAEALISRFHLLIVRLALPFLVFFLFESEALFGFVFGNKWDGAAPVAVLLSVPYFLLALANWLDRLFDVISLQRHALILEIVFAILAIGSFALGFWITSNPLMAIAFQAVALCGYHCFYIAYVFRKCEFSTSILSNLLKLAGTVFLGSVAACLALSQLEMVPRFLTAAVVSVLYLWWVLRREVPRFKLSCYACSH